MSENERLISESQQVGMVLGTESATPLEWWVAIEPEQFLQLDDVVLVRTTVPGVGEVRVSGVVDMVRAQHEGSRFESDVFLVEKGVLPLADRPQRARRLDPRGAGDLGAAAARRPRRARPRSRSGRGAPLRRDGAAARGGLSRDGQPIYLDLSFLDGRRGAHINISGVSGVATKTTYASFVLYSLFHSGVLGGEAANTKALDLQRQGRGSALPRPAERRPRR